MFDLIESVSRAERRGAFVRVLLTAIYSDFSEPLGIIAAADLRRDGGRYEVTDTIGDDVWALMDGNLSYARLQRRLAGQAWYIQRGLKRLGPSGEAWYDLIFIPVGRDLRHVLGFFTRSMAGDEGANREQEFQTLAQLIRLTVDRHRQHERLQEILTIAREQQMSLLPPELPPLPGYRGAQLAIPAYEVGGDYHQVIPLGPHSFALAVADAKGKGFDAAVLATALHAALRVVNATPFKVTHKVSLVNRGLAEQGDYRNLVSVFYAELDDHGRVIYVNCAHPPALVVRAGSVEELEEGGMFLGLSADSEYRSGILNLLPGDLLVAYTDGYNELFNENNEEFGVERIKALVEPMHGREPGEVVERLVRACDEFRGETPFADDRTLVVLRKD